MNELIINLERATCLVTSETGFSVSGNVLSKSPSTLIVTPELTFIMEGMISSLSETKILRIGYRKLLYMMPTDPNFLESVNIRDNLEKNFK